MAHIALDLRGSALILPLCLVSPQHEVSCALSRDALTICPFSEDLSLSFRCRLCLTPFAFLLHFSDRASKGVELSIKDPELSLKSARPLRVSFPLLTSGEGYATLR